MSRPLMPEPIKRAAIFRNMHKNGGHLVCEETGERLTEADILNHRIHIDHNPPLGLRYRDENGYHPPANDLSYLDVVSAVGHNIRTHKRRGLYHGDQTQIAKVKRLRGETKTGQKRKIRSRGFDKRLTKHMNGKVERESVS